MGPVHFQVTNNSGYELTIRNNPLGTIGEVANGQSWGYDFDASIQHNTNQMVFSDGTGTVCSGSVAWSDGGSGADDGWMQPVLFKLDGNMNGVGFEGVGEGWIELQPYNLMTAGGTVTVTYTKI
jgi:hypothetical protein